MKRLLTLFALAATLLSTSCTFRVQPGYEGVRVNLNGSDRGVAATPVGTGREFYFPWSEDMLEYPLTVQQVRYEVAVTSSDQQNIGFVSALNWRVQKGKAPVIYEYYRKDPEELQKTSLETEVQTAYSEAASGFTADQISGNRMAFQAEVTKRVTPILTKRGFVVERLSIVGQMKLPAAITDAITRKLQAKQIAEQKENELQQTVAENEKNLSKARAEAEAKKLTADADAYVNSKTQQTLTPELLQLKTIEKWDGELPLYGNSGPSLFKSVK